MIKRKLKDILIMVVFDANSYRSFLRTVANLKMLDRAKFMPAYLQNPKNPFWLSLGIGVFLIITIIFTLMSEYIPYSDSTTLYNTWVSPFPVLVKRASTILVPLRNL